MHRTAPVPELPEISVQSRTAVEGLQRLDGVRVLVVDDEAEARLLLATILTQNGAEARTAGSMLEAISSLDTWAPDVLVSDIGMPNGDGYDLIRRVRQLNAATRRWLPAVALTAYAHTEDRMRALAAGFQMHVTKPVEPRELLRVIASLTGRLIQS
jgi:CheY-like chemotaxis protein